MRRAAADFAQYKQFFSFNLHSLSWLDRVTQCASVIELVRAFSLPFFFCFTGMNEYFYILDQFGFITKEKKNPNYALRWNGFQRMSSVIVTAVEATSCDSVYRKSSSVACNSRSLQQQHKSSTEPQCRTDTTLRRSCSPEHLFKDMETDELFVSANHCADIDEVSSLKSPLSSGFPYVVINTLQKLKTVASLKRNKYQLYTLLISTKDVSQFSQLRLKRQLSQPN